MANLIKKRIEALFDEGIRRYQDTSPFFSATLSHFYLFDVRINPEIKTARIFFRYGKPLIEISPQFYELYIKTPEDAAFLISHEILHYILGHLVEGVIYAREYGKNISNMGMDIYINQTIYKELGEKWKNLRIIEFYLHDMEQKCPFILLIPPPLMPPQKEEKCEEIRRIFTSSKKVNLNRIINHLFLYHRNEFHPDIVERSEIEEEVLKEILEKYKGKEGGRGTSPADREIEKKKMKLKNDVLSAVKEMVTDERGGVERISRGGGVLPFYSRKDFVFLPTEIPNILYHGNSYFEEGKGIRIYLDVSGSVYEELPYIFYALDAIKNWIAFPIYGFSTEVFPISKNDFIKRKYVTTEGTDFNCVAEHILHTRTERAILITDGMASISPSNASTLKRICTILTILTGYYEEMVKEFSWKVIKLEIRK